MLNFKAVLPSLLLSGLGLPLLTAAGKCAVPAPNGHECNAQIKVLQGKNGWYAAQADACWQKIADPRELSLKKPSTGEDTHCGNLQGVKAYDATCDINIFAYDQQQSPVPGGSLSIFDKWDASKAEWSCGGQSKQVWGMRILEPYQTCPDNCEPCKGEDSAYAGWLWQW